MVSPRSAGFRDGAACAECGIRTLDVAAAIHSMPAGSVVTLEAGSMATEGPPA